ncbi:MAG: hypothetical protein QOD77_130 [Thermoplasmata archaeon]|jgi:exosortase/archaeosortase family protein|nr:hypothetical protein [Thermoplasmata archaeon]
MSPAPAHGTGPWFLGLALLGWGLAILLGVVPHEDLLVGLGLAAFGAALVASVRQVPRLPTMPAWLAWVLAALLALGPIAYVALARTAFDLPKAAMVGTGLVLAACAQHLQERVRLPLRGRPEATVSTLAVSLAAVLGAPLAVHAVQAGFEAAVGSTPVEAFLQVGLLWPLTGILTVLGWQPHLDGQILGYTTAAGPITVEVGAACSGIQAMALFAVLLALYLLVERPSGPRAALLTLIGLGGVYVANLLRLVMLMVVGYHWGVDALMEAHAQAGWVFFVAWAFLFAWIVNRKQKAAAPASA